MSILRRSVAAAVVIVAVCAALPAHARYGYTRVDTWVRYGDRVAGRNTDEAHNDTLTVWVPVGSTRKVGWTVFNPGTNIPRLYKVTFEGCDSASGFRFRYFRRDGKNITWPVTHDGYTAPADPHERAHVKIRVRSAAPDRSYTCVLSGTGNGPSSTVKLFVHS